MGCVSGSKLERLVASTSPLAGRAAGYTDLHAAAVDAVRCGPYDAAMATATATEPGPEAPRSKLASVASKTKHTCPGCGANVWGKPSTLVECVACRRVLQAAS